MEQWRKVPHFPLYEVSDAGRVRRALDAPYRSTSPGRILIPNRRRKGRLTVTLRQDGETITRSVHHLVLEAFVGERPAGMEACHTNGDGTDNRLSNLRWDNHVNNELDKENHGTRVWGTTHGRHRLNVQEVQEIRRLAGTMTNEDLGRRFGVTAGCVSFIRTNRTWKRLAEVA